jgi:hypothetical protein
LSSAASNRRALEGDLYAALAAYKHSVERNQITGALKGALAGAQKTVKTTEDELTKQQQTYAALASELSEEAKQRRVEQLDTLRGMLQAQSLAVASAQKALDEHLLATTAAP